MRVHKFKTANAAKIPANKVLEDHTDKSYAADSDAGDEHTPEICHSQKDNGFLTITKEYLLYNNTIKSISEFMQI